MFQMDKNATLENTTKTPERNQIVATNIVLLLLLLDNVHERYHYLYDIYVNSS